MPQEFQPRAAAVKLFAVGPVESGVRELLIFRASG